MLDDKMRNVCNGPSRKIYPGVRGGRSPENKTLLGGGGGGGSQDQRNNHGGGGGRVVRK